MQNVENFQYTYKQNKAKTSKNKKRNSYLTYKIPTSFLLKNKAL